MRDPHVVSRDDHEVRSGTDLHDLRWLQRLRIETDEAGWKHARRRLVACREGDAGDRGACGDEQGDERSELVAASPTRPGCRRRRLGADAVGSESIGPGNRAARRAAKQPEIDGFRLRRGVGAELVSEEPSAALVHSERLGRVAGGGVCLHQRPVAALPERLELGDLVRIPDRVPDFSIGERCVTQAFERTHEDVTKVAPLVFDPGPLLARQKDSASKLGRSRRLRPCLVEVARCECCFRSLDGNRRRVDVDPRAGRQLELVAAEGARQRRCAVDAALGEQRTQLGHQHPERLLPRRRKLFLAPEQLCQLVTRDRPPLLRRQIGEQDPALATGEALLVEPRAVRLVCKALGHRDS